MSPEGPRGQGGIEDDDIICHKIIIYGTIHECGSKICLAVLRIVAGDICLGVGRGKGKS